MTRIDELQEKYPSIHKEVIIKWETAGNGIKDTKDLDKISSWKKASELVYASEDEDLTLQRLKEETPWRFKDNQVLLPEPLLMKTSVGVSTFRKSRACIEIREIGDSKFGLFEGDEMIDVEVFRYPRPRVPDDPRLVTSRGTHIREMAMLYGTDFLIMPTQYCEYFNEGTECKFCNWNPSYADGRAAGVSRSVTINPEETAEALKIYDSEVTRLKYGTIVSGAFKTREQEARLDLRFIDKITQTLPHKPYMRLCTSPMARQDMQRLRDAGLSALRLQMETFDERLFAKILPGKSAHTPRDGWLEAYQDAVDIFGLGNVAAKIVGGLTMQGPEGYATWQEARDSHIEGDRWFISHGVYPCMCCLRWAPGSPFSYDDANRKKFPPTEFYLDVILAHHAAMKEFGFYGKVNKHLYGTLMGLGPTIYLEDLGIIEMAGDAGKWNEGLVPYEENYIAQALDAIRSGREVKLSAC